MHLDPRRLSVLLNVHRSGGVLAAADVARVTPSAISQQIARLEEETGITVLDRQPGGAVLTSAGRILVMNSSNFAASRLKPGVETFAILFAITSIAR